MNRRTLLTYLAALCWWRPAPSCPEPKPVYPAGDPKKRLRLPWSDETDRRIAADPYDWGCDYEAFEAWFRSKPHWPEEFFDDLGPIERIGLYALIYEVVEHAEQD